MTLKNFVLDALSKFWNKLKGSYITPMQTEIDSLSFVEGTSVEGFYNKLEATPGKTVMFSCVGAVSQVITGNTSMNISLRGIVKCMDYANHIYDFMCSDGWQMAYTFRTTFTSSTTCSVSNFRCISPFYASSYSELYTYLSRLKSACPVPVMMAGEVSTIISGGKVTANTHGLVTLIDRNTNKYYFFLAQEAGYFWHINCQIPSDQANFVLTKIRGTLIDNPLLTVGGTAIAANTDLDTILTAGNYYCNSNANVQTLTNCPTAEAFKMFVSYPVGANESYVGQEIKEFSHNKRYYRWYSKGDSTWRAWETLAPVTGGASTIATSNLTASRALISNSSGKVAVSATTSTELGYVNGVTSAIQTQLNGKQASITGGASTITSSNLTASRALISNSSGKVAVSDVTSTELGYLDGVTSAVQTQLNNKQAKLSWAVGKTQSTVSSMTLSTANTYYKIGTESVTFAAGTYIACIHVFGGMASSSTTPTCTLTLQMGSSATDGNVMRKATMKIAVNTTAGLYTHWTDIIKFTASTTYYMWVCSNFANTVLNNMTWTIDAIKIA